VNDPDIRAAALDRLESLVSPGDIKDFFRLPDHGVIGRAADGTYFVECMVVLSPQWMRERGQIEAAREQRINETAAQMADIIVDGWEQEGISIEEQERRMDAAAAVVDRVKQEKGETG